MILQIASNGSCYCDGQPITADRYAEISTALTAKPDAPAGYAYHLTDDLTWAMEALPESAELERSGVYTRAELEEMSNAELETILWQYGITANMTKANLIRLILSAQGGDALV